MEGSVPRERAAGEHLRAVLVGDDGVPRHDPHVDLVIGSGPHGHLDREFERGHLLPDAFGHLGHVHLGVCLLPRAPDARNRGRTGGVGDVHGVAAEPAGAQGSGSRAHDGGIRRAAGGIGDAELPRRDELGIADVAVVGCREALDAALCLGRHQLSLLMRSGRLPEASTPRAVASATSSTFVMVNGRFGGFAGACTGAGTITSRVPTRRSLSVRPAKAKTSTAAPFADYSARCGGRLTSLRTVPTARWLIRLAQGYAPDTTRVNPASVHTADWTGRRSAAAAGAERAARPTP